MRRCVLVAGLCGLFAAVGGPGFGQGGIKTGAANSAKVTARILPLSVRHPQAYLDWLISNRQVITIPAKITGFQYDVQCRKGDEFRFYDSLCPPGRMKATLDFIGKLP